MSASTTTGTTSNQGLPPFRQIRTHQPSPDTIVVYQAYCSSIASAAVAQQKLSASPDFRHTRMTWVKPSWAWMLYRCGYSYKDKRQECVLALTMRKADFIGLLERGALSTHEHGQGSGQRDKQCSGQERVKAEEVRIQWDPERSHRLEKLGHRSIQIGIPGALSEKWTADWIVRIEDVTERARKLKKVLDETPDVSDAELVEMGLVPVETVLDVPSSVREGLRMDLEESKKG
ncbi:hypothetical protein MKZ38_001676 [Zalerion maritima]|uniref:ATP-dependent RNA helicase DHX8 n=1 Tax=Zalerion maritima TaxID=339359 RepID=A0AAD5WSZ8_9PEZI|nr:hypothetical protein MKZ38_001676 [Zalerion maritima]